MDYQAPSLTEVGTVRALTLGALSTENYDDEVYVSYNGRITRAIVAS